MYAIRGATTVENDCREEIFEATKELLNAVMKENGITPSELISLHFTQTKDLVSVYPATAARLNGFGSVALFSGVEPDVKGGLPKCIRVIAYVEGKKENVVPVYLGKAKHLREETK